MGVGFRARGGDCALRMGEFFGGVDAVPPHVRRRGWGWVATPAAKVKKLLSLRWGCGYKRCIAGGYLSTVTIIVRRHVFVPRHTMVFPCWSRPFLSWSEGGKAGLGSRNKTKEKHKKNKNSVLRYSHTL